MLDHLHKRFPGLSAKMGAVLSEAAMVSFERQNHVSGVNLTVSGEKNECFEIIWSGKMDTQISNSWLDQEEATEFGAVGMSVLLAIFNTGFTVIERAIKYSGIDYWLGYSDGLMFEKSARLEISGIFKGSRAMVNKRVMTKQRQVAQSHSSNLPVYVSVIEFGEPFAKFERYGNV